MTNNVRLITAEQLRRSIPAAEMIRLDELTNDELRWLGENAKAAERRAFARWELDYREQAGIWSDIGPDGTSRRLNIADDGVYEQLKAEQNAEPEPIQGRTVIAAVMRAQRAGKPIDVMQYARANVRRRMSESRTCTSCGASFNAGGGPELCTTCWRVSLDAAPAAEA